ncbi:MAG6410 family transglutaminase-related lipoprotein [Mycoplasma feriruminatoris]|uniref:Lipoprotein n=1 Tax=Mycoplasma feriruminatoris TaxID=1179777 RepID=A0AAQ3DQI4_9MOLU|nr:transglutaminase domain-containing protein [Mycoplasma feriruminatoris]WFQ95432.1 lipoprotein [Mycoplasma feriruminatoris]
MTKKYNKKQIILSSVVLGSVVGVSVITTSCSFSKNYSLNSKVGEIPLSRNYKGNKNDFNIQISDSFDISKYSNYSLQKLENFYPEQKVEEFKEKQLSEQDIQKIIFDHNIPSNYYSHPKFKLEKQYITLDNEHQTEKLKLVDSKTNEEVENVNWYQRLRIPTDKLLKSGQDDNDSLVTLKSDGSISVKEFKDTSDAQAVELWAEYKGSLYKATITVVPVREVNIQKAKEEAKKIVSEWRELPTLEKITKAYDWMTKEVKFNYSSALIKGQTAYSSLVEKISVCTGYAKGFQMLMDELGILCTLITSDVSPRDVNGVKHVWNLVEIDGEWYHIDTTSDRIENNQKQEYRFFLLHDDDFTKDDVFTRNTRNFGQRLRNLKSSNFVKNKEDIELLIDKNFEENKSGQKVLKVKTYKNVYGAISEAFDKAELEIRNHTVFKDSAYSSYNIVSYWLENKKEIQVRNVKVQSVDKYTESHTSKILGKYAIKINLSEKVDGLKAGNFTIENAMIKEVRQDGNSYILYLDHFKNFGKITVKLNNIKKRGFKFTISNSSVTFNVEKFKDKPQAIVKTIDENRVLITNVKPGMQYRNNINDWIDITEQSFIANIVLGRLQFRFKDSYDKFASDVQNIEITKARDVYNMVKLESPNTIIGVDNTMEYRVINKNSQWEKIIGTKIENLKSGTYEIRSKANDKQLASNPHRVTIN